MGHDVAARLAQGRPAVDDFATFVWACRLRGHHHPDLTHAAAVHDLYAQQDGLDLVALDADCAALRTAAATAAEAATSARDRLGSLTAAWEGPGVQSCTDFLQRHCAAAESVAELWRQATRRGSVLYDELWRIVDTLVADTLSAAQGAQPEWIEAARAVLSGTADETAVAIVDQQLRPFVDTVVAGQWVAAVRGATAAVRAAYRTALEGAAVDGVRFEIPGDLGPRAGGVHLPGVGPLTRDALGAWPGQPAAPQSSPGPPPAPPPVPVPATDPMPAAAPVAAAAPDPVAPANSGPPPAPEPGALDLPALADPILPEPGAGQPDVGQPDVDRPGAGQPDADRPDAGLPDLDELKSEEPDEDPEPDEAADQEQVEEEADESEKEPDGAEPEEPAAPAPEIPEEPTPTPGPDCADLLPPDGSTPCEMAADELPQVGR